MRFKKIIISLIAVLLLMGTMPGAFAADIDTLTPKTDVTETITRAEETTWYFRVHNGVTQMRLWSESYQKWLTDWTDC